MLPSKKSTDPAGQSTSVAYDEMRLGAVARVWGRELSELEDLALCVNVQPLQVRAYPLMPMRQGLG